MRHDIFYQEHHQIRLESGVDIDEIDFLCDHLSIADTSSGRIVGSYRITSSERSRQFYSTQRFDLRPLLKLPGIKLELGRACVAPEYRRGSVIALLWRGIGEYCLRAEARYLFGCASIRTTFPPYVSAFNRWLTENGHFSSSIAVVPHGERRLEYSPKTLDGPPFALPALFKAYLNAGAKVISDPALDRKLRCVDYLTLLDMQALSPARLKRYGLSRLTSSS